MYQIIRTNAIGWQPVTEELPENGRLLRREWRKVGERGISNAEEISAVWWGPDGVAIEIDMGELPEPS